MELAIPTETENPRYLGENLAYKLLERIYESCHHRGIKLIVIDIPFHNADGSFRSSFPADWGGKIELISDAVVYSTRVTKSEEGGVHVPHGHHHISESTHRKFAEAITNFIMADVKDSTLDPVETSSGLHFSGLTD